MQQQRREAPTQQAPRPGTTHQVRFNRATDLPRRRTAKPPRFGESAITKSTLPKAGRKQLYLRAYDKAFYNGPRHSSQHPKGKQPHDTYGQPLLGGHAISEDTTWKQSLPSQAQLCRGDFGRPDTSHSFTQVACFETIAFFLIKNIDYFDEDSVVIFYRLHPLIPHMARMYFRLQNYDFRWVRAVHSDWATTDPFTPDRIMALLAALFHYNTNVSMLMRWLSNKYTGSYHNIADMIERIRPHVDEHLLPHLVRVLTVGCPHHFNAETSRENALKYWRHGNSPSVDKKLAQVMRTMTKEARNNFVIPIPGWTWRYIPHLFISPQHILEKPGKKDRSIHDLTFRMDPDAIPINMMTSTPNGSEFSCQFGDVFTRLLTRVYNLRITYPNDDIILHASDVKSCFRQLKHAPDIMGAFSYVINGILFLQCGLTFGADFSPPNWEIPRRVIEQLATSLFNDNTLRDKHRTYLNMLSWDPLLGKAKKLFTPAKADSKNRGVRSVDGTDSNTPHDLYVDDDVYAEVYHEDRIRVEQAIAAGIEAIFLVLSPSNLTERQDPISWDKLIEMVISYLNRILGTEINTRTLMVRTPHDYVQETTSILQRHWHSKRKSFVLIEIEKLVGRLGHIANTAPWLQFLMSHVYTSIAFALKHAEHHLVNTQRDFCTLLKVSKRKLHREDDSTNREHALTNRHVTFAQSQVARKVHHTKKKFYINATLRLELRLITSALSATWISLERPIGHMIDRDPSGKARSDSSLDAAGGYSFNMKFWWYIQWPKEVRDNTLRFIARIRAENGTLISINVLEYAAVLITQAAATHYFTQIAPCVDDPHPIVLYEADNATAESWAIKACKSSLIGRALGRLQCAMMINNPVGTALGHVSSSDNEIADRLSRATSESHLTSIFHSLLQDFPQLGSCRRFHPSHELLSHIMAALLSTSSVDPLEAGRRILKDLGWITTSGSR